MSQLVAIYPNAEQARPAAIRARARWLVDVRRADGVHGLPAHDTAWATSTSNLDRWWPLAVRRAETADG